MMAFHWNSYHHMNHMHSKKSCTCVFQEHLFFYYTRHVLVLNSADSGGKFIFVTWSRTWISWKSEIFFFSLKWSLQNRNRQHRLNCILINLIWHFIWFIFSWNDLLTNSESVRSLYRNSSIKKINVSIFIVHKMFATPLKYQK